MAHHAALSSNMEDYLEAIFHISSEKQAARAKDIADRLKVNKSSVTGALRSLSEKGYVNYAPYDIITLTGKGKIGVVAKILSAYFGVGNQMEFTQVKVLSQ